TLSSNVPLQFSSIPWPSLTIPCTPSDITPNCVREFICHTKRRTVNLSAFSSTETQKAALLTKKEERLVVKNELKNWHPDKFTTRVLARIMDGSERETVRAAADIVQKTLTGLL
ncbi:uncharacterized protein FOMMEDRAFT_58554, partial [Fomitiporia mediterranea MF3/22]|uniref:uncharacterized protein n=1 Tax=Fomitiporia mediterranea (strain MF3/22) TaxID=694068 RepID=UPI0004409C85